MIKAICGIAFYVSDLRREIGFYEKQPRVTKKYEYSSYSGFGCSGIEMGLMPKEKVEMGKTHQHLNSSRTILITLKR